MKSTVLGFGNIYFITKYMPILNQLDALKAQQLHGCFPTAETERQRQRWIILLVEQTKNKQTLVRFRHSRELLVVYATSVFSR